MILMGSLVLQLGSAAQLCSVRMGCSLNTFVSLFVIIFVILFVGSFHDSFRGSFCGGI